MSNFWLYTSNTEGNSTVKSSITLTLDPSTYASGAEYFGIPFLAGDPFNAFRFYRDGGLVFEFSTQSLIDPIPQGESIMTLDGTVIDTNDYYGQPNTGLSASEPYAYLNFLATGRTTFETIVMGHDPAQTDLPD